MQPIRINQTIPKILHTTLWIIFRRLLKASTRFVVEGKEHLAAIGAPAIFASNHQSEMDPVLIPGALTPRSPFFPIYYVARGKGKYEDLHPLKKALYGGRFFQWLGAYPTRPGTRDYEQSLAAHIEILSCGRSIQIFPEGKKSIDGVIRGPARGGVAFLSWRTNTPVVPVAISGAHRTTLTDFFLRRKRYRLTFGKPIMPKELFSSGDVPSVDAIQKAAQSILDEIKKLLEGKPQ